MATRGWETAMRHLNAPIEAEPGFWEAHKALGECFLRLNKPGEARKHLEEASRLPPVAIDRAPSKSADTSPRRIGAAG